MSNGCLLKRDFDKCRAKGISHPFLEAQGYGHLIHLTTKTLSFGHRVCIFAPKGVFTRYEETNLKIGGGLDDVWLNTKTGKLHIVDYKSTSLKTAGKSVTLRILKITYKRQMDLYVWIMRRKGFDVSDTDILYCTAIVSLLTFLGSECAAMHFKMAVLPYNVRLEWIEPVLFSIQKTLKSKKMPKHNDFCEYGKFLTQVHNATAIQ